jgi:hypothetical protein
MEADAGYANVWIATNNSIGLQLADSGRREVNLTRSKKSWAVYIFDKPYGSSDSRCQGNGCMKSLAGSPGRDGCVSSIGKKKNLGD